MTYLPSLLKKIDGFYSLTKGFGKLTKVAQKWQTYVSPEDDNQEPEEMPEAQDVGLYQNVMTVIGQLSNEENYYRYEEIANELTLIAELYKTAVEINGGYHEMKKYIRRAMANIDFMIDESDGTIGDDIREIAEDTLDELASDLRARSKVQITQQMDEPQAIARLKLVKDNYNRAEAREEMANQKTEYEAFTGTSPAAKSSHIVSARPPSKTPDKYRQQIESLIEDIKAETNPATKGNLIELAQVLQQIVKQMEVVRKLDDEIKVLPDDQEKKQAREAAFSTLEQLRAQRRSLRRKIDNFLLKRNQEMLEAQFVKTHSPKEREWLQAQIDLLRLRMSTDLRKRDEIKARKALIHSLGVLDEHGDFQSLTIPTNERIALDRAIQLGQTMRITKADYDSARHTEMAKQMGRKEVFKKGPGTKGRGLAGVHIYQTDFSKATFPGLIKNLRDLNNTAIDTARRYIANINEHGNPALKPYVDAVSKAIQEKNNVKKYNAMKELRARITNTLVKDTALKSYEQNIRLLPFFKKIESELYAIAPLQDEHGAWHFEDVEENKIVNLLLYIQKVELLYRRYYQSSTSLKYKRHINTHYNSVIRFFATLTAYITANMMCEDEPEQQLRIDVPPEKQVRVEPMEEEPIVDEEEEAKRLENAKKRMMLMSFLMKANIRKEGNAHA